MTSIKASIKSHVVPIYFALAFAISWGGLLAIDGLSGMSGDTWQSDPRLPFFFVAMLAGPSTAVLLLTSVVSGRTGFPSCSRACCDGECAHAGTRSRS